MPYDGPAKPPGHLRAITQLQRTGLLILRGFPVTILYKRRWLRDPEGGCALRIYAYDIIHGEVWNVENIVESRNAYTNLSLGLYMDLQYVQSPVSAISCSIYPFPRTAT